MRYGKALTAWLTGMLLWAPVHTVKAAESSVTISNPAAEIQKFIALGRISELRWPDFRDVQSSVSAVYSQIGYSPLWIANGALTAKGQSVLDTLRGSATKGLDPEDYDAAKLSEWAGTIDVSDGTARGLAVFDIAITINLMRYASALHQGRIDPRQVHFAIRQKDRLDAGVFVREFLLSKESLPDLLGQIEPQFRGYRETLAALVRIQQRASDEPAGMPARPRLPLRRGQIYPDVAALAARLTFLGDLNPFSNSETPSRSYEGPIVEAVKRLQVRHGLTANGVLDAATWSALTTPLSRRVEQLQLTLERWRWLPSAVTPAIVVNIPEFQLRAYGEDRKLALRMRVVVGRAYRHKTPVFEDNLEAVIIRPWWNVPLSIQRNEMVPELRANPDYLHKNNLEVVNEKNQPVYLPAQQELLNALQSGDLRLRQEPGPANSLGLLKFDFPNDYSVYMHGTPARQLFSQARRDFSHGCIRVEDPDSLAEWILRRDPNWSKAKITAACNGERTIRVAVSPPISVLVLYGTAVIEEDGEAHFFDDVYGYDSELKKALASGYPYLSPASKPPNR
jgi:murein L,D-transpeptidase YcbB/YkuD